MPSRNPEIRPADRPITTTVVRSLAPIDLETWLDRYARAIVEAKGTGPTTGPQTPTASNEAA